MTEFNNIPFKSNKKININQIGSQLANTMGLHENKSTYSYNADGSVNTITEKDKNDVVISTTTFTYKTNGDVNTSVLVKDGQTITTQYIYDANGNLTDTVNTKGGN